MVDYATASRMKDYYQDQLLRDHPEIVLLAPRLKLDDYGMPTGEAVIVIGVDSRKSFQLSRKRQEVAPLPARLAVIAGENLQPTGENVEVVVEEHRGIVADSLTDRVRPCSGGYSVGHFRGTGGTLGGVVRLADGSWCGLLSCSHVLAALFLGTRGDDIYQPGRADGGTSRDVIGLLENWIPLKFDGTANEVDCAVARALTPCEQSVARHVYGIGTPTKVAEAAVGQAIRKCGKATGLTRGQVSSDNATVVVSYSMGLEALFVGQLEYSLMAMPGDSGSLLWDGGSLTVVGIHIGSNNGKCYGNRISKVLTALSVSLV